MKAQGNPIIVLYGSPECHLCDQAREVLEEVREGIQFELVERDITLDDDLHRRYLERIPVVEIDGQEAFELFVDAAELRQRLGRVDRA
jgi:glutaredoxin